MTYSLNNYYLRLGSYTTSCTADKSLILNIGRKVSLLKTTEAAPEIISTFSALGNPSYGAISSSKKLVAYKNTSGRIAIHDAETGELILKHNAVKCEGYGLYFIHQDRRILTSTWDCDIFTLDISTGDIDKTKIGAGEYHGANILPGIKEDDFFVMCKLKGKTSSTIFKLTVNEDIIDFHRLLDLPDCDINIYAKIGSNYMFPSNDGRKLYTFNAVNNTFYEYVDLQQVYDRFVGDYILNYEMRRQYIEKFNITDNGKYLILVYTWKTLLILELPDMRCVNRIEHDYVSNILLFNNEKSFWIGTWEKVYIYDFDALISGIECPSGNSKPNEFTENTFSPDISDEELELTTIDWIHSCFSGELATEKELLSLPEPCQHVYSCLSVYNEIQNGGFNQLFVNDMLPLAKMSIEGFSAMGVPRLGYVINKAIELYKNNVHVLGAHNDGTGDGFSASYSLKIFDDLDDDFIDECGSLDIAGYIRANIEHFPMNLNCS